MVTSLIKHERIVTTVPKAKELRKLADHVVTLAKSQEQRSAMGHANKIIREKPVLTKLFQVFGPRYERREGGYTRILKLSKRRAGDGAEMCLMEYVDRPGEMRAARPPTSVQKEIMAQYLKDTIGLEPLSEEKMNDLMNNMEEFSIVDDASSPIEASEEKFEQANEPGEGDEGSDTPEEDSEGAEKLVLEEEAEKPSLEEEKVDSWESTKKK
jgi:large subunit ribosomal protein L17